MRVTMGTVPLALAVLIAGCSDEAQQKWGEAGEAVKEATVETAQDVKEGTESLVQKAKEETAELTEKARAVIQNARATDPDTGEVIRQ